jgi:pyruvate dehydrogenase E2 component (dihydrolipoamide acetyltransferase)
MAIIEVKVPDIGDFDEVAVIELMVKLGDTVKAEQSLITVESDKASMEIPSSHAGVVKELKVALGDKVKEGSLVVMLEVAGEAAAPASTPASTPNVAPATAPSAPAATPFMGAAVPKGEPFAPVAGTAPVFVHVPDIGDFKDVAVIEVFVKVGDTVKVEQSLITVESDKASMEIPSSHAGVIKELKVKLGDTVNIGDLLAILEGAAGAAAPAAPASTAAAPAPVAAVAAPVAAAAAPVAATAAVAVPAHNPTTLAAGLPHASPSVRKFARELGVPLAEVKGTGHKGRITPDDVQAFTRGVMSGSIQTTAIASAVAAAVAKAPAGGGGSELGLIPWPKVDFAKFGPIERKELGRIKKISGANLLRNAVMIPAVTNHDDADITDLEAFRVSTNKENEKSRRQGHHAGLPHQGLRGRAEEIPRVQQQPRRRQPGLQAVLPHRLCSRHAQRPGGACDQGCRQKRHLPDQPGNGRAGQKGPRRQAGPR